MTDLAIDLLVALLREELHLELDPARTLQRSASLDDLDLDSLQRLEIIDLIERRTGVLLDDPTTGRMPSTVADLLDALALTEPPGRTSG